MDLTLSPQDQSAAHQLLLATPEPGADLLPRTAVEAIVRLIPCDVIGAGETDRDGFRLRGFDLPEDPYDGLGTHPCEGPVPTGVQHLTRLAADDADVALGRALGITDTLRVGYATPSGTVAQLYLDRRHRTFSARDVAVFFLLEPVIGRLMTTAPRLCGGEGLSSAEIRVLELVATGASNRDVAQHLSVTVATVRKHLEHSYRKLGVTNRTAAVAALSG